MMLIMSQILVFGTADSFNTFKRKALMKDGLSKRSKPFCLKKCARNHDAKWLQYLEELTDALLDHGFPIQPMMEAEDRRKTILFKEHFWLRPISKEDHMKWEIVQMNKKPSGIKTAPFIEELTERTCESNCELKNWITSPDETLGKTAYALKKVVFSSKRLLLCSKCMNGN